MNKIRPVIGKNIASLRSTHRMTQAELAEKLNYSDKAVSKWERGESIPDIGVLTQIADLFHVSLDTLVGKEETVPSHDVPASESTTGEKSKRRSRGIIIGLSVILVWMVATLVFVIGDAIPLGTHVYWIVFIWAIPASMIVWLVLNCIWFNTRKNYIIISILMWSTFLAVFLTLLLCSIILWQIFLLGVPGQIAIIMWSQLSQRKNSAPSTSDDR